MEFGVEVKNELGVEVGLECVELEEMRSIIWGVSKCRVSSQSLFKIKKNDAMKCLAELCWHAPGCCTRVQSNLQIIWYMQHFSPSLRSRLLFLARNCSLASLALSRFGPLSLRPLPSCFDADAYPFGFPY
jgi:hypothetical protein